MLFSTTLMVLAGCSALDTIQEDFGALQEDTSLLVENFINPVAAESRRLKSDRPDDRREALFRVTYQSWGDNDAFGPVYRLMAGADPDPAVRAAALLALARHGGPEDAPLFQTALTSTHRVERRAAAIFAQRVHMPDLVTFIAERSTDAEEDVQVRRDLTVALSQYQSDRAVDALVSALDASRYAIVEAGRTGLQRLTGMDHGTDSALWQSAINASRREGQLFAQSKPYAFPVYNQDPGFFDQLAYWRPRPREVSGPPIGLVLEPSP
jgi:hypothetical protein